MERKKPASGEFYRHFKGNLYQVKMLARDSETQAWSVVYQEMYSPFQCWVRDLEEFMEPVDGIKYPDCSQKYRFERVEPDVAQRRDAGNACQPDMTQGRDAGNASQPDMAQGRDAGNASRSNVARGEISREVFLKAIKSGQPERYLRDAMSNDQVAERGFLELLDADTFLEKRQIFMGLRNYLTPLLISNIAVALDIVLEDGNQEEQFESVLHCLEAFEHYEGGRLR